MPGNLGGLCSARATGAWPALLSVPLLVLLTIKPVVLAIKLVVLAIKAVMQAVVRAVALPGMVLLALTGCVSHTVRTVDLTPAVLADAPPPENVALALGIAVFDKNVPKNYEVAQAAGISTEIRTAEANYFPYVLKNVLADSGYWRTVRVVPRLSTAVEVTILGRIDESDGEHLRLHIGVVDATGEIWFRKDYDGYSSKYAYGAGIPASMDPFHGLYQKIGADLAAHYQKMPTKQIIKLRRIAELRFAQQMAPEAFADFLSVQPNGRVEARRLPADDDPMIERIDKVRLREFAFIDALDKHYQRFFATMNALYQSYRKATYDEAVASRRLREEALTRTMVGAVAVVGGLAAASKSRTSAGQAAGGVAIISGAALLKSGFSKRADARFHADALTELAASLSTEVSPHTIALESESITLTGNVDEQYSRLREVLSRAYRRDLGLPAIGAPIVDDDAALKVLNGPSIEPDTDSNDPPAP